jgi:glycosyltransferase involved in cell wall biosynthesis
MHAMDVFVMPSFHEGLPVAGLEAQAAGLPCLFSDRITAEVNVVPDLVRYLPLEASKEAWAEAVRDIACRGRLDPEERLRAFDQHGFSIAQSVQQLSELYRELAAG